MQPGCEILKRVQRQPDGRERIEEVEVRKRPEMTGSGINIAIVDDGLQTSHEDLSANARTDIDIDKGVGLLKL